MGNSLSLFQFLRKKNNESRRGDDKVRKRNRKRKKKQKTTCRFAESLREPEEDHQGSGTRDRDVTPPPVDHIEEGQTVESSPSRSEDGLDESDVEVQPREKNLEDFKFLKLLGRGSFGKVVLAELRGTEKVFAVKILKKEGIQSHLSLYQTLMERRALILASEHPFLTQVSCCFQNNDHLYFAMEYMIGGDLQYHISRSRLFNKSRTRFYAAEIVSALMFLHRKGIIHRDIKPSSIMLDAEGHCKVADFGMCKGGIEDGKKTDTLCGTPLYMAPEIVSECKYGASVDWWSLGVMMYEMMVGFRPFNGRNEMRLYKSILEDEPLYPIWLNKNSKSILKAFLVKSPENRLGCVVSQGQEEAIKVHPFFKKIDWELLEQRKLTPPFIPKITSKTDAKYFKAHLTSQELMFTRTDKKMMPFYQKFLDDFYYCDPNIDS